ncbi:MAG: hypothetical protein U0166_06190 [Acidobacteriota bacterium]
MCTSLGVLGRQEEAWPLAQEGLAISEGGPTGAAKLWRAPAILGRIEG